MTAVTPLGAPLGPTALEARAFEAWRATETLVAERWISYLGADRDTRRGAFAAYVVALDAEAAAARELAAAHLAEAA